MTSVLPSSNPSLVATSRGSVQCLRVGEAPYIMALHGAMGGWDQSLLLTRTIANDDYGVVAVSRPGYLGTALATARRAEDQADLYAALLDSLGIERVAVAAVSGGGPSAIHFALRHPKRCWALVLVSTAAAPVKERLPLAFHALRLLGRTKWFERSMRRRRERDPEAAARASIPDGALRARTLVDPETGPLFRALLASTADSVGDRLAGTVNDVRVTRTLHYPLERVGVPTLVVHGTADPLVPFEQHGAVLAARIPGARLVAAGGGEHVAIFTHRHVVRPHVVAFLDSYRPAPRVTPMM